MKGIQTPSVTTVGIIGGVGPLAGAFFYEQLVRLTPAQKDQEHLKVYLISDPAIPSRVDHLTKHGVDPGPILQNIARQLEAWGADILVIPSATTHAYYQAVVAAIHIPVIHLLLEVSEYLSLHHFQHPAIACTEATTQQHLYDPFLASNTYAYYPDECSAKEIQQLIDEVKAGENLQPLRYHLAHIIDRPWAKKADCIVMGCTEIPLIAPERTSLPLISITEVLAQAVIKRCYRR